MDQRHQQQALAQGLAREGATLVFLGVPPGTEFGIDLNYWNVGDRFRGVKLIPPGLHFIYFSAVSRQGDTAPRTGFFHIFGAREVLVRHYDPASEDLQCQEANTDEVERIRANIRELDRNLGPYPLDSWRRWVSLTQHVNEAELSRLVPLSGRVCSAAELIPVAPFISSKSARKAPTDTPTGPTDTPTDTHTPTGPTDKPTDTHTPTDPRQTPTHPQIPTDTQTTPTHTPTDTHTITDPRQTCTAPTHPQTPTDTPTTSADTLTAPRQTPTHPHIPTDTPTDTPITSTNPPTDTHTPTAPKQTPTHPHTPTDTPTGTHTHPQLPEMKLKDGTEFRWTRGTPKAYREGASPSEVTHYSLDSSYSLRHRLAQVDSPPSLLAELQVAFISFLVGHVWSGWEHWRTLLAELCKAEEVLLVEPDLYSTLLSTLHYQVNEIPEDFFVDIVESNNFLASALSTLFANIADNSSTLPLGLWERARRFKEHLTTKFEWDLSLEDEGEDAPVVVEL